LYACLEADAALWNRTIEEQFIYVVDCCFGVREPLEDDEDMRARLKRLRPPHWTKENPRPFTRKIELFRDLMQAYFYSHLSELAGYPWKVRLYRQLFLDWEDRRLSDITRSVIRRLHVDMKDTPTQANHAVKLIKQAYNWALDTEDDNGQPYWRGDNPARGIKTYRTYSRIRVLTDAELSRLLPSLGLAHWKLSAFVTILLCTGCRMTEARKMRWEHVDLAQRRWLKARTKNGLAQYVPLPQQAVEVLSALPNEGPYVFMGSNAREWSRPAAEKAWGKHRVSIGLQDVCLHDFRRTVATRLYEAERDELIVKACLNHYDARPLAVYVRLNFDRLARSLQANADRIWALLPDQSFRSLSVSGPVGPSINTPKPEHCIVPDCSDEMEWPG
jgi:integrase